MPLHHSLTLKFVTVFLVMIQWRETESASCNISVITPVSINGNTADTATKISWSPLPTAVNYQSTADYDDGGLGPFFNLARSFVNTSIPAEVPIDIIGGIFDGSFNILQDYKQIIDVSLGYIVCIAVGLLFILIFTLVGLIFCCCRCCGNCGGKRVQKETNSTKKKRVIFSLILFLLIVFLSVGLICLFVTNGRMSETVTSVEDIYDNSLTDAELFFDLIKTQVKHLSVENFNFTYEVLLRDMNGIDALLGVKVKDSLKTQSGLNAAINAIVGLSSTLQSLGSTISEIDAGVTDVENKVTTLNNSLNAFKVQLDSDLTACGCGGNIDTTKLSTSFDSNSFPSLSDSLNKINNTKPDDLNNIINTASSEMEDIPCRVKNESQAKINDIRTMIDDFSSDSLNSVNSQISNLTSQIDLKAYKGTGDEYFTLAKEYDQYRFYGGIGLACLVLLIVALMLLGLMCGFCASKSTQKPTERGCMANSGGNMLIASVAFIFIFSWLLMLLTTLTYAIGAPLEKWVCQPLSDFDSKLYTQVLDKPNGPLGKGYFLGGLLLQNSSVDITISGILKDCRDSKAAYSALKLNNLFDIDSMLDYKQYIDINSTLGSLGDTVDVSVKILTPEMKGYLQDIKDVVNVDTTAFLAQLNNNLSETDLTVFAQSLRSVGDDLVTNSAPNATANNATLYTRAAELDAIQANEYQAVQTSVNTLRTKVTDLDTSKTQVVMEVDAVNTTLQYTEDYFSNNASALLTEESTIYVERLVSVIDSYINYTTNALKNDMGQCNIIYNVFASIATVGICKTFLDAFNGFWLSLGWCIFFFVPSLIFAVKLAKYFRKMSRLENRGLFDLDSEKNFPSTLMNEMNTRIGTINSVSSSKVFPSSLTPRKLPTVKHFNESTPDSSHTSTTEISQEWNASAPPDEDFHNKEFETLQVRRTSSPSSSYYSEGDDNKVGHMDGF